MKNFLTYLFLVVVGMAAVLIAAAVGTATRGTQPTVGELAQKYNVEVLGGGDVRGSGIAVGNGKVITNSHVCNTLGEDKAVRYRATGGYEESTAWVLWDAQEADLCLLGTFPRGLALRSAPLCNTDSLRPGDTVLSVGNSLGRFTARLAQGVYSGTMMLPRGARMVHDDVILPGNSGGALWDVDSRCVAGVNVSMMGVRVPGGVAPLALSFAIPLDTLRNMRF